MVNDNKFSAAGHPAWDWITLKLGVEIAHDLQQHCLACSACAQIHITFTTNMKLRYMIHSSSHWLIGHLLRSSLVRGSGPTAALCWLLPPAPRLDHT